jgi:hypothetical protein
MADQLFKKRRARDARSLRRKRAKRSPYDMVLIVCEGEKTEPNYFKALIDDLRLNTANVLVAKNIGGSSPKNIVDFALKEYKKEKIYDRIFCVFDKDNHTTFHSALDKVRRAKLNNDHVILAITSVPCFEFWLLLHFAYTTKPFSTTSGSICNSVIDELKRYIPSYEKGNVETYQATRTMLDIAIKNSKMLAVHCETVGTDMPSTKMHEIVVYLKALKN